MFIESVMLFSDWFAGQQDKICAKMCQKVSENIKHGNSQTLLESTGNCGRCKVVGERGPRGDAAAARHFLTFMNYATCLTASA